MIDLYKNIKKARLNLGLTQTELAAKTGYADKGMIAKIENGKVDLPQSKIELFASALRTTPRHLMGWVSEDSDDLWDYYVDSLNDISDLFRSENYDFVFDESCHQVVIKSYNPRIFARISQDDLLATYEKLRMDNLDISAATILEHIQRNLSPDEAELLLNYQKLNDLGKDRAREDVADLTEIPKYIADYPDTMAAHFDGEEMTDQQKAAVTRLNEIVKQQKK